MQLVEVLLLASYGKVCEGICEDLRVMSAQQIFSEQGGSAAAAASSRMLLIPKTIGNRKRLCVRWLGVINLT